MKSLQHKKFTLKAPLEPESSTKAGKLIFPRQKIVFLSPRNSTGIEGTAMKSALVVIDMSQEQLYPDGKPFLPPDWPGYKNILELSRKLPKDRVLDTRLWMSPEDHSTLAELYSIGRAKTAGAELVSELKDLNATFVKKVQYSAFYGSELESKLKASDVTHIFLTGINTDYCVFATALDAFYRGFKVYLVQDACFTITGKRGHKQGIEEFTKFLDRYGTTVTTAEALKIIDGNNQLQK